MRVNMRICLFGDNWRKKKQRENDGKVEECQCSECCRNPEKTHFSLNGNGMKICTIGFHLLQVGARMGPYFSRKRFPLWTCVSLSVQPLKDLVAQQKTFIAKSKCSLKYWKVLGNLQRVCNGVSNTYLGFSLSCCSKTSQDVSPLNAITFGVRCWLRTFFPTDSLPKTKIGILWSLVI